MEFIKQLKLTNEELSNMTETEFIQCITEVQNENMSNTIKQNIVKYYVIAYNLSKKENFKIIKDGHKWTLSL